jgi:DNA-binding transcriptional LysR family regulator
LFEREGRKIILTEAGKKFIPIARTMIGVYEEGKAEMDRFSTGLHTKTNFSDVSINSRVHYALCPKKIYACLSKHRNLRSSFRFYQNT